MKSKYNDTLITILAFSLPIWIFAIAFCFSLLIKRVPGFHQDQVGELTPIYDKQSLTQSITLEQSGLDTVMIFLKNARLDNQDKFIFQIADVIIPINGYNIGDGDTIKFQFPPLNLPAGSQVNITLSAPDTKDPNIAIKAGISSADAYLAGGLSGKFSPRDLSFQLFYQPASKKAIIASSFRDFISRLFNAKSY